MSCSSAGIGAATLPRRRVLCRPCISGHLLATGRDGPEYRDHGVGRPRRHMSRLVPPPTRTGGVCTSTGGRTQLAISPQSGHYPEWVIFAQGGRTSLQTAKEFGRKAREKRGEVVRGLV